MQAWPTSEPVPAAPAPISQAASEPGARHPLELPAPAASAPLPATAIDVESLLTEHTIRDRTGPGIRDFVAKAQPIGAFDISTEQCDWT